MSDDTLDIQGEADPLGFLNSYILESIRAGQYYLLIGAGASVGERNRLGLNLPLGDQLSDEIREYYGVGDEPMGLQRLTEVVKELFEEGKTPLEDYLTNRFFGCSYSWQTKIFEFTWAAIWSLNIDDVLENAASAAIPRKRTKSFTWRDPYSNAPSDTQQIIHLHGYVNQMPKTNYIFSILEYANAISEKKTWHSIFSDTLPNRPYIIIGTKLADEFDLASAISRLAERLDDGQPTIFVSPGISPITEK
ncbi:SIR2 family protein [Deinococcus sp. SM5_A1]|uniref:SIR2 family protein n=1 Tax=Deinococcus sp. SM5_A1 TaxID=3379094 RepID=UPI00385C6FF4